MVGVSGKARKMKHKQPSRRAKKPNGEKILICIILSLSLLRLKKQTPCPYISTVLALVLVSHFLAFYSFI